MRDVRSHACCLRIFTFGEWQRDASCRTCMCTGSCLDCFRMIIVSLLVAIKFHEDRCYLNKFYAEIGGLSCEELYKLEIKFLLLLNFNLHVLPEKFNKGLRKLVGSGVKDLEELDLMKRKEEKRGLVKVKSQESLKTVCSAEDILEADSS
eukprot:TRINITY_DN15150_c0_g1_i2.p1 TRINITY_DN15150_c0_g1~~TRINITY_DN15150_c0_g1_i2.p1  ORF type:complete len:150 (-),score=9.31 TRINITY_DN15150_c0_g1_i2:49-498(-)